MPTRRELANALRFLSIDAVQKASSGHPGMPMGMADIAEVLWNNFLKHHPKNPQWANRDRFVLSNGHGSMLLYSLLHLSGYDLSLDEIKNFRQLHSQTPGHPEYGITAGVETTTGPLGQGLANAVGMALAEKILAARFNKPGHDIINHHTYVFAGDGCLMEGVSHEAASLAGTWKLGKLILFYDDNGISIDGPVAGWFTDNTPKRFEAYGWHVISKVDGHDSEAIHRAIVKAQKETNKPTIICCQTKIGFGSPLVEGKAKAHGSPLGDAEIAAVRKALDWNYAPFEIPAEIKSQWNANARGEKLEGDWDQQWAAYEKAYPELASELGRRLKGDVLPWDWQSWIKTLEIKPIATRKASEMCLNAFGPTMPELIGGSADLTESNLTHWKGAPLLTAENFNAQYIEYGVREFGMSAIINGLTLHGGFVAFGGTFLTFSDYARNAIRLAALMKVKSIFVYTHDSIGVGEDGPTHQPIEHAANLRLIPQNHVWRPCDITETAAAWASAITHQGPTCLLLTRQAVEPFAHKNMADISKGAYILHDCENPEIILIATGSEVELAMNAAKKIQKRVRVVSMPCVELFESQSAEYREKMLPKGIKTIAIEAGSTALWYKYADEVIGIDRFGESAPAKQVYDFCGLTAEKIVALAS